MLTGENGGVEFGKQPHSDYIEELPTYFQREDLWIEVEAKQKELSVFQLRERFS